MGAIREPVGQLRRLTQLVQAREGRAPSLDLIQLGPATAAGDPWTGVGDSARQGAGDPAIVGGRIATLLVDSGQPQDAAADLRGIVFDEWSEAVPLPTVMTALAVHANRPSNEAPQSVLLAVPPDLTAGWSQPTIEAILNDTLDLAAERCVDLPALGSLGQIIPMLQLPLAGLSFNKEVQWFDLLHCGSWPYGRAEVHLVGPARADRE